MKSIGSLAGDFWKSIDLDKAAKRAFILQKWPAMVDDRIGSMCILKGFRRSTVLLLAGNPAAAMELRYRKNELLNTLNEFAGEQLFDSVKVIQRPLHANER